MHWPGYGNATTAPSWRSAGAEKISPRRVHRNPPAREVLADLLARARRDAVGRELRGMAYRAGLPV
ncbi:MAG: hypothetical protein JO309_16025 [Pseudonocardiales bacterium]|nr:hypothetical protein [Pseudonocardiales bacterium]MBV9730879.1 hypothetical protein [Pseudonocardiales bacterium]